MIFVDFFGKKYVSYEVGSTELNYIEIGFFLMEKFICELE
jgi:hypothetical protein